MTWAFCGLLVDLQPPEWGFGRPGPPWDGGEQKEREMHGKRGPTCRLGAVALLAGALSGIPGGHATGAAVPGTTSARPSAPTHQVTLLTGDRVTVSSSGIVGVVAGRARPGVAYSTYRTPDGHIHVVPSDVAALVDSGRLDPSLFDVTLLLSQGLDDRSRVLPVIVRHAHGQRASVHTDAQQSGSTVTRDLTSLDAVALRADRRARTSLWSRLTRSTGGHAVLRPEISNVWLDRTVNVALDKSVPAIGAPTAWAKGYDGTGVKVAVLDTGIDVTHPDLKTKVVAERNFTAETSTQDLVGHGTHVASIIAGTGAASSGRYRGVAPGASLLDGKVCFRSGSNGSCKESDVLAGMQWAVAQGARVVNMSFGGWDTDGVDPEELAINQYTATNGTLFVVAAGNDGPNASSLDTPGAADAALTVGAVDSTNTITSFSSRGPRLPDDALKPDITAPGAAITAARSSTGIWGVAGDSYVTLQGTSMATPHVAGAAAILAQQNPLWSAKELKGTLMESATPNPAQSVFDQGAGEVNVAVATGQSLLVDPPSLSLGRQLWPHSDDPVLTRTLTYRNSGSATQTVDLSVATRGPDGAAAPSGMFTINPSRLTLAPGASATATLTVTTTLGGPDGLYGGYVVGSTGSLQVRTPFGVDKAVESHAVTVRNIGHDGLPATHYNTSFIPVSGGVPININDSAGPVTRYLSPGSYLVRTVISEGSSPTMMTTIMVSPRFDVTTSDRTLTFDARTAGRVNVGVNEDPTALLGLVEVDPQLTLGGSTGGMSMTMTSAFYGGKLIKPDVYLGQADPAQQASGFTARVLVAEADAGPAGDFGNSPRSYSLLGSFSGQLPTGWSRGFSTSELARIDQTLSTDVPGAGMVAGVAPVDPSTDQGLDMCLQYPYGGAATRTEFVNPVNGVAWQHVVDEVQQPDGTVFRVLQDSPTAYNGGSTTKQVWDEPVIGPALGQLFTSAGYAYRQGDTITIGRLPLFGDSAGHPGWEDTASIGQLELTRNGTSLGTVSLPGTGSTLLRVPVPAGSASYALNLATSVAWPAVVSTNVRMAWTFGSSTVSGTSAVPLPLWTVAFRTGSGTPPAGVSYSFPATVVAPRGSSAGALSFLAVQYSVDGGTTWTAATVTGTGATRTVSVLNPPAGQSVSLKAYVRDYAGNTAEQTVIGAYRTGS